MKDSRIPRQDVERVMEPGVLDILNEIDLRPKGIPHVVSFINRVIDRAGNRGK